MIIGISMDQEICLILGQVSLNLLYWKKNLQKGYMWSGEEINKKTADIQVRSFMVRNLENNWEENAKLKEKQKCVQWKSSKLENARKLRGIYFIDPEG